MTGSSDHICFICLNLKLWQIRQTDTESAFRVKACKPEAKLLGTSFKSLHFLFWMGMYLHMTLQKGQPYSADLVLCPMTQNTGRNQQRGGREGVCIPHSAVLLKGTKYNPFILIFFSKTFNYSNFFTFPSKV